MATGKSSLNTNSKLGIGGLLLRLMPYAKTYKSTTNYDIFDASARSMNIEKIANTK